MPVFLARRDPGAAEMMDDPECDRARLYNTYRQFRYINVALSRSREVYRRWLRPAMRERSRTWTLLDIGFGGGDIPLELARWAANDDIDLQITGIEIDERAVAYVRALERPENVEFRLSSTTDLLRDGERFDFVLSNHLLHHLSPGEFDSMLREAAELGERLAVMVDLQRSDIAYAAFSAFTLPFFRDSYIRCDGLASLKRSYTYRELRAAAPPGWKVQRLFPFRQVLLYDHGPR